MERFLTAFVLGLCTAPLAFILTLFFIDSINRSDPSHSPTLSNSLVLGLGLAVGSFVCLGGLAWFLAEHGYLRPVQTVTGLIVAGWSIAGAVFAWKEPRHLDYTRQQAVIEAEIRMAKSLLNNQPLPQAVIPSFLGGDFDHSDAERIREEGDFLIMPWETKVTVVYNWTIWLTLLNTQHLYFPMNLSYRPTQSTDWSAWAAPSPHKNSTTPTGITLRYRYRLVPQSVERQ
ncbi:Rossmann-fold NAD(P)-binding domain-containing protein [Spirosoma flavum]|uniref:DUF4199 domain-containing protein n=1 Tax=Spirosoma flavum TaxID=2048557 RepID=A0ABW6AHE9_9BACT